MGNNFHSAYSNTAPKTTFTVADMGAPLLSLDRAITYSRPAMIGCDGTISWLSGTLTWSGSIHIYFNSAAGNAIHNSIAAGSLALSDSEFAYVTLNETNDTVLTMSKAAITTGSASNYLTYNLMILGYRNASDDNFYPVGLSAPMAISMLAVHNALLYKGVIDCAANPNYPAADAGHVYIVSVAGKIGGASGTVVVAGDMAVCNTDSTASGDQATVGAYWNIFEKNVDFGNVTISGGTINGTSIGGTSASTGKFTSVTTDTISESTGGAGVTIDGVTLKDGGALDITGGTNTFNIANGTASLDVAAGATLDVNANLTVESASAINQDVTTDGNPQFASIELGHASDTTLTRVSAGVAAVEGKNIYLAGGTDVAVADGGTGASTLTVHGILLGSGTDAITPMTALAAGEIVVGVGGADPHALAAGATTKILVGGGAADPVWTEATGSGAPVRATSPTLVTPVLGTPTSGDLQNCTAATTATKGVVELATNAETLAGTDTGRVVTPDDLKYVLDRRIPQYYGVSWDESADTYVRTGSTAGQTCGVTLADAFLPVHRRMRGCLVADDGTVNYYLCATDWTKKEDGVTASDLTGTDGQVMVEIPKFWYRYGYSGTTHTWEVSPVPLTGFKVHEAFLSDTTEKDYLYVGAYEACLYDVSASKYVGQCYQTSVSAVFATSDDSITIATRTGWATALAVGQKLVITGTSNNNTTVTVKTIESATKITVDENLTDETAATTVIQTQTDVTDTTGDKLCSVSGVCPITGGSVNGTRAHFRTWAENRGGGKTANDAASAQWSQLYGDGLSALQLLYLTEYASFYSQSVLGYGIAALSGATWTAYNDQNPIAKSGNGNAIGNASGCTATYAITTGAGATSVYLKYRGIENFYGHIWKFTDGFKVNNNIPYLCNNFANFSDAASTDNYTNPTDVNGVAITMHNASGYQGTLELCGRAFMPASLTGGSASAKITDNYLQAAGWRVVCSGGAANHAAGDGAFFLLVDNVLALVHRAYGARLVMRK